ncbi:MAG: D-alanine--D-alanine ligase family protein [bacterium]|nr:D-alanine--D-alanine ligase family protein [bacterium]
MKYRLGVIFGGKSVEHEISVITAVQVMANLNTDKYDIIPIYITKDLQWYTGAMLKDIQSYKDFDLIKRYAAKVNMVNKDGRYILQKTRFFKLEIAEIDLVLPIVHGCNMEDGTIQGFLNIIGVPYVGSDIYTSAIGQDKVFMKQIFKANNIPITEYKHFMAKDYYQEKEKVIKKLISMDFPLIVKPATLGSSIGITKADTKEELVAAIDEAVKYDSKIVVERVVDNLVEVNCSVLGGDERIQTSEIEEIIKTDKILSYKDKYQGSAVTSGKGLVASRRIIPARLNKDLLKEVSNLAIKVFECFNCLGVVRIDFLVDKKSKKVYVNEINTIPGSLSYYLWEPKNINYTELLDEIIRITIRNYKRKVNMISSFDTNILSSLSKNGFTGSKSK